MYNLWWIVIVSGIATLVLSVVTYMVWTKHDILRGILPEASSTICTVLVGVVFLCALYHVIALPITAKNEYNEFMETKALVAQVYQGNYEQYENAGLNAKIIELNQWLARAKSNKKQWGNWSMYCNLDVENLDYIVLGGVQQ